MIYDRAREAYMSFVNFAPSVQHKMAEVEKWHNQFEVKRHEALEDFEEMERLKTWYEYFQKSYAAMEEELVRRRKQETALERKVEAFRKYLMQEMNEEQT